MNKRCSTCHEEKEEKQFFWHDKDRKKLQSQCKACKLERQRAYEREKYNKRAKIGDSLPFLHDPEFLTYLDTDPYEDHYVLPTLLTALSDKYGYQEGQRSKLRNKVVIYYCQQYKLKHGVYPLESMPVLAEDRISTKSEGT